MEADGFDHMDACVSCALARITQQGREICEVGANGLKVDQLEAGQADVLIILAYEDGVALKSASSGFDSEYPGPPSLELRPEVPVQGGAVARTEEKGPLLKYRPELIEIFIERLILPDFRVRRQHTRRMPRCRGGWL